MSHRRAWLGVLAAALVAALLVVSLPRLIALAGAAWLRAELARRGVGEVTIDALEVGARRVRLEGLVLGAGDVRVERIELRYAPGDLLRLRAGEVSVRGVRARGRLGDEVSFGALGALAASATGSEGREGAPPFRELSLVDARLELETPGGLILVPVEAELRAGDAALAGSARFRVEAEAGNVRGGGHAVLDDGEISLEADLEAEKLALGASEIVALDASLRAAGPPEGLVGELTLEVDALLGSGLHATLTLPVRIRAAGGGLILEEMRCAPLRLDTTGQLRERITLEAPFASCLESGEAPLLAVEPAGAEPAGARANLVLRPAPLSGALMPGELAFEGESPRLAVEALWSGEAGLRLRATSQEGELRLPRARVAASGLGADFDAAVPPGAGAAEASSKASLRVLEIRDLDEPARFTPVAFDAQLERRGPQALVQARLDRAGGKLELRLEGAHELATGRGEARVSLVPIAFAPGDLALADLSPLLGRTVRTATGRAELSGTLSWQGADLSSALDVSVRDFSLETDLAAVQGLETSLRILRPWPVTTAPEQRLRVARITAGLPLEDLAARFQIEAGRLRLASAEAAFLGGSLRTEGVYDPALPENRLVLEVADLDAARLVAELELDDLSATGLLGGRIPVALREGGIFIEDGRLDAAPPGGVIRYGPVGAPPLPDDVQGMDLLLAALRDFRYQELSMTLDGQISGELAVGMHLLGSNPDFFDGHPVAFNLDLEAPVAAIVRGSLVGLEIPEEIRRGLEAGRRKGP